MGSPSDTAKVLALLKRHEGDFVRDLYRKTGVMVHSRVSELRKRGYVIECVRFGPSDYRYRLIGEPRD